MHDLMLQCAGIAAIAVALVHSVLGETKVFSRATIEPARLRTLIHGVWHCSTVDWIAGGILLIVTPLVASEAARHWIVAIVGATYLYAAIGNAWATRGRSVGWIAMSAVIALAGAGY